MMLIADFKSLLVKQSGDSDMIYWTSDNWDRTIKECLLTFGAIAGYWKYQVLVETTNADSLVGKQFYDLLVQDDVKTGYDKIKVSLTYQDVLDWLDIDLVGYSTFGTNAEIVELITNTINYFQSETRLVVSRNRFNIQLGQAVAISEDVLDIVKAYYIDSSGFYHALQLADENRVSLFDRNYTLNQGRPKFYSINNLSLQIVDLFPKPNENGYLELIYVKGKLGEQSLESDCLIPNNLVPYIKYKVEADLLSKDDITSDPFRTAYCEKRWLEGLLIGRNYSAITNSKVDGLNKVAASLQDFDSMRYGWYNDSETSSKKINAFALAGYNIIALNRMPINNHSLLFEVIANAPIGEVDINLRSDYIPYLLDYCLHLASIKDGIANIQKTQSGLENFIKISVSHNQYLQQRRISYLDLLQKSKYPLKQAKIVEEENAA